jgi:hypothetical protein
MKKIFLATMCAVLFTGASANAATNSIYANFHMLENFTLVCESILADRKHIVFIVKPSEMEIELHNEKGEAFNFPITRAQAVWNYVHNLFGNPTKVPEMQFIDFNDNGGKRRTILFIDRGMNTRYIPAPENGEQWGYSCI